MLAYIKKDLILIKKDIRVYLPMFLLMIFALGGQVERIIFLLVFYVTMMTFTSFAYEEESNFFSYSSALPKGRTRLVAGKYISNLILIAISGILSLVLYFVLKNFKPVPDLEDLMKILGLAVLFVVAYLSASLPISFKFGSHRARLITVSLPFIVVFAFKFLQKNLNLDFSKFISQDFTPYYGLLVLGLLLISYFLSLKIVKAKDF